MSGEAQINLAHSDQQERSGQEITELDHNSVSMIFFIQTNITSIQGWQFSPASLYKKDTSSS